MAGKEKMTARAVAAAKSGRYCDGRGLWLVVSPSGARKWVFRFTCCGRVTEMGLGGRGTTLAEARKKADEARKIVAEGNNPIEAKREARTASAAKPTFGQCADALLQAKSSEWRNEKHRAQWQMTLADYVSNSIESGPRIGVQKAPLLAGRNDSARPRRSWSGLRSRGERGGVRGGFEC